MPVCIYKCFLHAFTANMLDFYTETGASVQGKCVIKVPILQHQITAKHCHQFTPIIAPLTMLEETNIIPTSFQLKVTEMTLKLLLSISSG